MSRILKVGKERNTLIKHLNDIFKLGQGVERLVYFIFVFLLMCHITSCLFYLCAKMEELTPETWVSQKGYQDYENFDVKSKSDFEIMNRFTL